MSLIGKSFLGYHVLAVRRVRETGGLAWEVTVQLPYRSVFLADLLDLDPPQKITFRGKGIAWYRVDYDFDGGEGAKSAGRHVPALNAIVSQEALEVHPDIMPVAA